MKELLGQTILVVDDIEDTRDFLCVLFEQNGMRAIAAAGGHDALRKIRKDRPAVVLTDLCMPKMTGLELARRLRSHPAFIDIPIALISGTLPKDPTASPDIDVFLKKTCTLEYLLKTINQMILNTLNGTQAKRRQSLRDRQAQN
ncbi:response regulator [Herbaspirillum lusitanum]|uniref:Response regulator n=1 Tax=Herbaspirillum lusitanum TaxID=213312 RepID=A0ABW9A4V8_9BURK